MCRIALSIFTAICLISITYATRCSSGPGYRFPITCPGLLDSTKSYCCENNGKFDCCDAEEFKLQEGYNDVTKLLELRHKRDYTLFDNNYKDITSSVEDGLSTVVIAGISVAVLILLAFILCCCCCCACCPCYHWCHPNSTNVTIVQPSFGYPGNSGAHNFAGPAPPQQTMPQDPPQYARGGYSKLSAPSSDRDSSYIQ